MKFFRWLTLLLLFTISNALRAAGTLDLYSLSIEDLTNVRVTGSTLTALPLDSVPNAITVFTRDEIRRLPVNTIEELLNLVPEVQAIRSTDVSGTSMISIRGRRISYASREILLLLNGIRIENPQFGGFSTAYPDLPLANIERVEIIRGPGSAIYGSNAFTGIINIITATEGSNVTMGVGSHQWLNASMQYSAETEDSALRSNLFLSATKDNGESMPVDDVFNEGTDHMRDPYRQYSLQWQLRYRDNSRLQLVLSNYRSEGSYAGGIADDFNVNEPSYGALMFEQALHWHKDIKSEVQLGLSDWSLQTSARPYTLIDVGSISNPPSNEPLYFKSEVHSREYWLRWKNDWWLSEEGSLQFGFEYRNPHTIRARGVSNFDLKELIGGQLPVTYYNNFDNYFPVGELANMNIFGLYVQYQRHWSQNIETIAGLRFDSYSSVGNNISPRLGLIYHASPKDTLKFLRSQAFRAPQFDERFSINNPVILGNEQLKPETVETTELIWIHNWSSAWVSLNFFSNRFRDAIVLQLVGSTGARMYANDEFDSHSEGMSVELNSYLNEDFQIRIAATHFFDIPESSFREATDLFSAAVIYTFNPWTVSLTVNLNGERENRINSSGATENLDAYALSHLKFMYSISTERGQWQPYIEIRNLFDEDYATPASIGFNPGGIANHRRELRLGISIDF